MKTKLVRITTVPISLQKLLEGQLTYMQSHFEVTAISSDKEKLEALGKQNGYNTYAIEMTRQITPLKDLKAVLKLYRYLRKEKVGIVHSHTPKAGIVGMLAAKLARVPLRLHTVAGLPLMEATGAKRILLNYIEKLTYACATRVYPNSKGLQEFIIEKGFAASHKLDVIADGSSNGIDTNYFNPDLFTSTQNIDLRTRLNIDSGDFVFIFVGRLVGDKGVNELIEAIKILKKIDRISNYKLLLVGTFEKELDPLCDETLSEIRNNGDIISVGYQLDVRPYYAISNVLVFPSYREGFPNVVMQAGAMGLPCIVSNINGCNEIIFDEENGVIIPVKDANSISVAMLELMDNYRLRYKLIRNARSMIIKRYEQKILWDSLVKEYMRLLIKLK